MGLKLCLLIMWIMGGRGLRRLSGSYTTQILTLWFPVILFCIYFLKSFHRFQSLSRCSQVKWAIIEGAPASHPTTVPKRNPATVWAALATHRWCKAERDDFCGVIRMINDIVGRNWLFLPSNSIPIDTLKEWVLFKRVITAHS